MFSIATQFLLSSLVFSSKKIQTISTAHQCVEVGTRLARLSHLPVRRHAHVEPQTFTGCLLSLRDFDFRASSFLLKKFRPSFGDGLNFFGADDEARTRYLHLGKVALYRMSYIRMCSFCNVYYYTRRKGLCQELFFLHSPYFGCLHFAFNSPQHCVHFLFACSVG